LGRNRDNTHTQYHCYYIQLFKWLLTELQAYGVKDNSVALIKIGLSSRLIDINNKKCRPFQLFVNKMSQNPSKNVYMSQINKNQYGEWLFIFPISHLMFSHDIDSELTIGDVTFITLQRLARKRKHYGLNKTISELRKNNSINYTLDKSDSLVAITKMKGDKKEAGEKAENNINEKLLILSVSQLFYNKGANISRPFISKNNYYTVSYVRLDLHSKSNGTSMSARGSIHDLILNNHWKTFNEERFFFKVIKMISKDKDSFTNWEKTLYRSLIMAGKSIYEEDVAQSFLFRMIAIESIITNGGGKHKEAFIYTFEMLIGWHSDWEQKKLHTRIIDLYRKRNNYVHDGKAEEITSDDLLLSETLIFNLYNTIFSNMDFFDSKEKLPELLKQFNAIKTLEKHNVNFKKLQKKLTYSYHY
jgi:hypothetical protein